MEYKRTMYLLSLLYSAAEGTEKEKIGELFKQSVTSTEEYQHLKKLIQTVSFLGVDGDDKHKESEQALRDAISDIAGSADNFKHIDLLIQQIENELNKSDNCLSSASFFDDDFFVVKSESVGLYNKFYRVLANCICYYLISQFGVKAIRNLTFNQEAGFQTVLRLVNQQYGNELMMSYRNKKPLTWSITRASFTEDNLIAYEGYKIEYSDTSLSSILQRVRVDEYYRIAPYVFAATSPTVQPTFVGIGNIIGVDSINCISLLGSEIITSLPISAFSDEFEPHDLIGAIMRALNSDNFCISPEDLVAALNRQKLSNTVAWRRQQNQCIFCGKPTAHVACMEHFYISNQ